MTRRIRTGANNAYNCLQPSLGCTNYVPNGLNQYNTLVAASIIHDTRGNLMSDGATVQLRGIWKPRRLACAPGGGSGCT